MDQATGTVQTTLRTPFNMETGVSCDQTLLIQRKNQADSENLTYIKSGRMTARDADQLYHEEML